MSIDGERFAGRIERAHLPSALVDFDTGNGGGSASPLPTSGSSNLVPAFLNRHLG